MKLLNHLKKYLEIYLAMLASIVAVILGLSQDVSVDIAISATSMVLGIIAFSILRERQKFQKLHESIQQLNQENVIAIRGNNFFTIRDDLIDASRDELCIMARYGDSLQYENKRLRAALDRGCNIRILVCSPQDQSVMKLLALRTAPENHQHSNVNEAAKAIENSVKRFSQIKGTKNSARISVRKIRYIPPFVLFLSNPNQDSGTALVGIANFRETHQHAASIKITKKQNESVFHFFYDEFNKYWDTEEIHEVVEEERT